MTGPPPDICAMLYRLQHALRESTHHLTTGWQQLWWRHTGEILTYIRMGTTSTIQFLNVIHLFPAINSLVTPSLSHLFLCTPQCQHISFIPSLEKMHVSLSTRAMLKQSPRSMLLSTTSLLCQKSQLRIFDPRLRVLKPQLGIFPCHQLLLRQCGMG